MKFKVKVFLATFNGSDWIHDQINTILGQVGVDVLIYVSDDFSNDTTLLLLKELAKREPRIQLLPKTVKFGSAGRNFYRLILDSDLNNCDYVAFADQDDIWESDKLIGHIALMQQTGVGGVSSNVIAFWPDGKTKLIDKAQPQRELDYLFESAGPGCTFLMSIWLVGEMKKLLSDPASQANQLALHDWLVYAVCRASGRKWLIDSKPSLRYRQHDKNVLGANSGLKAKFARLMKISDGWYRGEVLKVLSVSSQLSNNPKLLTVSKLIEKSDIFSRVKLLRFIPQARRKLSDRFILTLMIIFGLF